MEPGDPVRGRPPRNPGDTGGDDGDALLAPPPPAPLLPPPPKLPLFGLEA